MGFLKRVGAIAIVLALVGLGILGGYAWGKSKGYDRGFESDIGKGNVTYQNDVNAQMCSANFWVDRCKNPDSVLANAAQLAAINSATYATPGTGTYDLAALENCNGNEIKEECLEKSTTEVDGLIARNGVEMSSEEALSYYNAIAQNIRDAQSAEEMPYRMALCVKRCDMCFLPTSDFLGFDADDSDNESVVSALDVNEPFMVALTSADGFYAYGFSSTYSGWVAIENIAFCENRDEWLEAWQGDGRDEGFLVVTAPRVFLESSNYDASSNCMVTLGTRLDLVANEDIPANLHERGTWNNYVVWLPARSADGMYVKSMALIPQSASVHVGYLELTQRNVLDVAFACLGSRYNWGGYNGGMDCSAYVRNIYRCFGLDMPRDTTQQCCMTTDNIDVSTMGDAQKSEVFATLEPGSLLYLANGLHVVMYLGSVDGRCYVINDLGSVCESFEGATVQNMNSVVVNSLDVRLQNGNTWLSETETVVRPWRE